MKKKLLFTVCIDLNIMIIGGCQKKDTTPAPPPIPFQGPQNPSFETVNANWVRKNFSVPPQYSTGTGFLPSQGVQFMNLDMAHVPYQVEESNTSTSSPAMEIYQDGVDLSHSTTMTFDYTFTYTTWYAYHNSATVQMLFTSNGTQILWQQTIDSTSILPIKILNKTVTLPSLPSAGRLIIQTFAYSDGYFAYNTYAPSPTFCIDNIRVN